MANTKVQSEQIEDGSITADKLADGTIVAAELADNAVTTAKINADAVTGAKIADDAIDSEHYTDGSIDTAHIADAQITVAKMAANSVDSDQYVDGSIDTVHLGDLQVTTAKIANGNISTAKIADNAVTSAKIDTNIDIAGTFDVTGATVLDSTLTVAGDANFDSGTLFVDVSANKVGIGTTSPEYELEVKASTDASINIRAGTSSGDFAGLYFGDTDYPAEGRITYQNSDNKMRFWSDRQHVMTLDDNARVGIGTESPSDLLHVKGSSSANLLIDAATDNATLTLQAGSSDSGAEGSFIVFVQNTTNKWQLGMDTDNDFRLYNYADSSETLAVNSSGDISITGNLNLTGGGTIEAPSSGGGENLLLNAAGGIHLRIDSNGNSGDDQVFKVMKHTSTAVFTVAETGTATISGALVVGDKISHGNGELDLYDGGSNTILKNGVTNGNVKIQAIVSGVGAGDIARFGDSALGQVDLPYQSSFMAYSPAVTNGGGNRIVFGGTWHNVGADYSTTTGKYTAPRTGRYLVTASVLINPGSTTSYERILFGINEAAADTQYGDTLTIPGNSSYHGLNISGVFQIDSGDTISVYNMGQSPTYGTSYGSFSAFYLG